MRRARDHHHPRHRTVLALKPPPPAPVVLTLRALGLGDLLTAVPALRAVRRAYPNHHHVLATSGWLAGLALHTGAVDEVVPVAPLSPLPPDRHGPEVAVNLHGRGPQSHGVLRAIAPQRLVAFASPVARDSSPAWREGEHEVLRWCRLLSESGIPADPHDLDLDPPERPVPPAALGATLLHPGAASEARRWPVERWVAVARHEQSHGRTVVVTGSAAERPLAEAVAEGAGLSPGQVLAGTGDVLTLAAVVAAAARIVCGDTGVAHLATAVGTPSVVLFGPVPPSEWGPPLDRPRHRALWAGRRGDPHADRVDPGLLEIEASDVVAALACSTAA